MRSIECSACQKVVDPAPPNRRYWGLIFGFWLFSVLVGIGSAMPAGWPIMFVLSWVLAATTAGVLVERATSWTCPECGATAPPPVSGVHAHA